MNLNEIRDTLRNWVCSCTDGMPFLSDVNNVSLLVDFFSFSFDLNSFAIQNPVIY